MSIAMVFPGQGSQSVGMQAELADAFPEVSQSYSEASDVLGYDLWERVQQGPAEKLALTTVTQPAMLTAGVAAYRVWQAAGGPPPEQVAGHSLGEYTALVAAGSMSFADAMRVVIKRSELMQAAVAPGAGAMAAILGLADEAVVAVCKEAAANGVVEAVNFNSPGQVVIAGDKVAVEDAVQRADAAGARRAILLPVSVPAHSSLMTGAGDALYQTLTETRVEDPQLTVIAATDSTAYGGPEDIRDRLSQQVYAPVQWVATINAIVANGASAIIECGPGKVLAGLSRRISKATPVAFIDSPESLEKALRA